MTVAAGSAEVRPRVLVLTNDPIGAKLAGPGIRAWAMAEELSEVAAVRLLTWGRLGTVDVPFEVRAIAPGDARAFAPHEAWADVIILRDSAMELFPILRRSTKIIVADLYVPATLEHLEFDRDLPMDLAEIGSAHTTWLINEQLRRADFFLCASERQRMYWLGQLTSVGRINAATYRDDPTLRRLIDVAPFGISRTAPRHTRQVVKGVIPGIATGDKLLIWAGGIHNWFDPLTLIRAVARLAERRPHVRLLFMGTKNPNPGMPERSIVQECRELAAALGVAGKQVFFNESWVEFDDRQNYLLEADLGVSTHPDSVETDFSFRTRILDYLWAGLPMVVTRGDHFADVVENEGLGTTVPPADVDALVDALEAGLYDEPAVARHAANVRRIAPAYTWTNTLAVLRRFVRDPRPAADRARGGISAYGTPRPRANAIRRVVRLARREGLPGIIRRVRRLDAE